MDQRTYKNVVIYPKPKPTVDVVIAGTIINQGAVCVTHDLQCTHKEVVIYTERQPTVDVVIAGTIINQGAVCVTHNLQCTYKEVVIYPKCQPTVDVVMTVQPQRGQLLTDLRDAHQPRMDRCPAGRQ